MYFDVIGALTWIGLYLLGFILLPIVIYFSRHKRPWLLVLFVYLSAPVAWIGMQLAIDHFGKGKGKGKGTHQRVVEREYGQGNDLMAFSLYCRDRNRTVHVAAPPSPGDSLRVTIGPHFGGPRDRYSAARVHEVLLQRPAACAAIVVEAIEGQFETRAIGDTPSGSTVRAFRMCSKGSWRKGTTEQPRYEIVLGDFGERVELVGSGAWMTKSSIRLRDNATGVTLAEDSVYFFRHESGVQDCPDAMDQIVSLIADVFPRD